LDIPELTSSSAFTRRNPERWEFQVSHSHSHRTTSQCESEGLFAVWGGCGCGWDCWRCQAAGTPTPILDHIRRPSASVVFAAGTPAGVSKLGVTFCGVFKQSGTASASASVQYRNRPFTRLVPMIVLLLGADRPPSSDWRESLCFQPIPVLSRGCLPIKCMCFEI